MAYLESDDFGDGESCGDPLPQRTLINILLALHQPPTTRAARNASMGIGYLSFQTMSIGRSPV